MGAVNIWKSGKRRAEKGHRDRKQNFEYNLAWPGEIWGGGERGRKWKERGEEKGSDKSSTNGLCRFPVVYTYQSSLSHLILTYLCFSTED